MSSSANQIAALIILIELSFKGQMAKSELRTILLVSLPLSDILKGLGHAILGNFV